MVFWVVAWLIVALVAAVGETATATLFLATVAAAAVLAAVAAIFLPVIVQAAIFGVAALAGLAFVRPLLASLLGIHSDDASAGEISHSHLIGRHAVVTGAIGPDGGQIRLGQGEFWTARPFEETDIFPVGTPVEILLVDGLTALVAPVQPSLEDGDDLSSQLEPPGHEESQAEGATGAKGTQI